VGRAKHPGVRIHLAWVATEGEPVGTPVRSTQELRERYERGERQFVSADLREENLAAMDLRGVVLTHAQLAGANLAEANLRDADLRSADLRGANLSGSMFYGSHSLAQISRVLTYRRPRAGHCPAPGAVQPRGRCAFLVEGKVAESFLRGCGVPGKVLGYLGSLTGEALESYSCFISHSTRDEPFAFMLHRRIQQDGLRVWFAPEDVRGGRKLDEQDRRGDPGVRQTPPGALTEQPRSVRLASRSMAAKAID
jgi:hypothetical protein